VREFQRGLRRKTPEKIGIKAPLPEFIPPAPASVPKRVPDAHGGFTRSSSILFRSKRPKRKPLSAQKRLREVSSGPFASCSITESGRLAPILEAIMDDEKSMVEKFTDAVKGVVDTASTAAMKAMDPEPLKPDEEVVVIPPLDAPTADLINPMPPMIAIVKKKPTVKRTGKRARASKSLADLKDQLADTKKARKKVAKKAGKRTAKKTPKKLKKKSAKAAAKKTGKKVMPKKKKKSRR
jgi:hypothetical protein